MLNQVQINFISQTAKDYSLPFDTVKNIYEIYGRDEMYIQLEFLLNNCK